MYDNKHALNKQASIHYNIQKYTKYCVDFLLQTQCFWKILKKFLTRNCRCLLQHITLLTKPTRIEYVLVFWWKILHKISLYLHWIKCEKYTNFMLVQMYKNKIILKTDILKKPVLIYQVYFFILVYTLIV